MVEGARLESEYTPKAYRGFESLPLRHSPHSPASAVIENRRDDEIIFAVERRLSLERRRMRISSKRPAFSISLAYAAVLTLAPGFDES